MVRRSRGWADTARRATRLLLPVGPYQLNRLLDRIESAVESTDDGQELTKSIRGIIDECRVCCDSRFDRAVPWAGAVRVVEAYCDLRNHGAAAGLVRLERNEQLEDTPALPSLICMLAEASIQALPRKKIIVRTSARGNKLVVQITRAADAAVDSTLANRINTGFRQGVVLDRCEVDGRPMWELIFPAAKKLESFDWQSVMSSGDEVGEQVNSRYSKDAKRSFRRNGDVVRMQRSDVHDSKPTRLEDEYLILRRMMDVSPSFPQVTGCGSAKGIDWLSYKFRDGQPLSEWVQRAENRRQWFRVIADVDYLIRCLRENTVAHRDLNPTNLIMGDDGRLGLIDFDQAVADDRNFRFADSEGDSQGLVTNDIAKLIDKCGFARDANEAMARLDEVWGKNNQYELEFAGHVFPGEMPWYAEWEPIACALGDIREKRILVLNAGAPLLPVFLASGRAEVRIVADENQAAAISKIAAAADVEVKFANVDSLEQDRFAPESFDLVLLAGFDARQVPTDSLCRVTGRERQVLFEYAGSIDDAKKLVERIGLIWRGVAGYSARLCPLIVAVHPQHQSSAQWLKVGNS
jgi:predicted Ser/Thr protein kinase